jgi:hypothetical protein
MFGNPSGLPLSVANTQCCQLKEKNSQRNKTIIVDVFQTLEGVKYE